MAVRDIVYVTDSFLRTVCKPVTNFNQELKDLVQDMLDTMYFENRGIGLAAIQIRSDKRVIVMDVNQDKNSEVRNPTVMVNPEITYFSDEVTECEEGCLSIPEYTAKVKRPKKIKVKYQDVDGNFHEEEAEDLYAICIQHEIDHLNGKVFLDHIPKFKRDMIMDKIRKKYGNL